MAWTSWYTSFSDAFKKRAGGGVDGLDGKQLAGDLVRAKVRDNSRA